MSKGVERLTTSTSIRQLKAIELRGDCMITPLFFILFFENMEQQLKKFSIDELAERSADFEKLIDLLVDLSEIPPKFRTISTEKSKVNKLLNEIAEIVKYNKKPYQNNVIQQNLFIL